MNELSASDVALLQGNGNNGFMGGDNAWWIIILFLFAFVGWGNGGYGGAGANDNYVLVSDFAQLERKLDTVNAGLCDGFYATAQQFGNVNMNIAQNGYESRLATQTLSSQLADCCCQNREAIAQVRFDLANSTRDITEGQNANTNAILEALNRMEMNAKEEKINALVAENQNLKFMASQTAQNAYLVSELAPKAPIPAFNVPNPYASYYGNCCNG